MLGLVLGSLHILADVLLDILVDPPITGAEAVSDSDASLSVPFSKLGCFVWPQ